MIPMKGEKIQLKSNSFPDHQNSAKEMKVRINGASSNIFLEKRKGSSVSS